MSTERLIIQTDGASRGNPGPSAIGVVIRDSKKTVVAKISRYIGKTTNNQAEYQAIIAALEKALELKASSIELRTDSQLVACQLNGTYKVKTASIAPLYHKACELLGQFNSAKVEHVPREANSEADRLANQAFGHTSSGQ